MMPVANPSPAAAAHEGPACTLCGGPTSFRMERHGFPIMRCCACAYSFAVLPENFDFAPIYQDEAYWTGGTPHGYPTDYDGIVKSDLGAIFARRLKRINGLQPPPGRLLEIGCAGGYFLGLARGAGWDIAGVEISNPMRAVCARRIGCELFASVDEAIASGKRFDCVVMFEVLEHIVDPPAMLRKIGEMMAPGALLAVSTPNFESHGAATSAPGNVWFEPPAHIAYFGPTTLRRCLELGGFEPIELEMRLDYEMPLPPLLAAILKPLRHGKRLRPHGILGRALKAYQLHRPEAVYWMDCLVMYARKRP